MALPHNLKGTGFQISDDIRARIEKSLSKAEKLLQGEEAVHADVEVEYLSGEREKSYRAEFNIQVAGKVYRAEARGEQIHEAIDLATDEFLSELRTAKKKRLSRVRRHALELKDFLKGLRS